MIVATKKAKHKIGVSEMIIFCVVFVIFGIYALTIIYTFLWGIMAGLMNDNNVFTLEPFKIPSVFAFENYIDAFTLVKSGKTNMLGMLFNSVWLTVGGTILGVGCSTTLAYVVNKYKFVGRKLLFMISLIVMILPIVGSLPAQYRLVKLLGMANSPSILFMYCAGFGFNFIVMYGFFSNISWTYAEAGFIDGASDASIFFKIMLPQALPSVLSLMILASIGIWNDYQTPLLFLDKMPPIAVGLQHFSINIAYSPLPNSYPLLFAGVMISIIPIVIVFIIFQDTIMNNTVAGGLKG